jgi:O-antigen/teichoic acid export membrane protein
MTEPAPSANRHTLFNIGSSLAQVTLSAVSLLVMYSLLLSALGPADLGIWSLVVATSSFTQIANLGLADTTTRQVARLSSAGEPMAAVISIETAAITMMVLAGCVTAAAFPLAEYYLAFALDGQSLAAALAILPYGLAAFWMMMVTGVYQGGLYGSGRVLQRNGILMLEALCYPLMAYYLAHERGLIGLVLARLLQNGITLALSVAALRRVLPMSVFPYRWRRQEFVGTLGYAWRIQLISLLVLLCDPFTKACLARYGDISYVGFYEMANRLVLQFRGLFTATANLLVPEVARLRDDNVDRMLRVYASAYDSMFLIGLIGFASLAAASFLVSSLWIGDFEPRFIVALILLSVGWFVNSLGLPAYNISLGTGRLTPNVLSHIFLTLANFGLCIVLGKSFGAHGVIAAWSIALGIGGLSMSILFGRKLPTGAAPQLSRASRQMLVVVTVLLTIALLGRLHLDTLLDKSSVAVAPAALRDAVVLIVFLCLLLPIAAAHPTRKYLMLWVKAAFEKRAIVHPKSP